jgi:hypothetical protein
MLIYLSEANKSPENPKRGVVPLFEKGSARMEDEDEDDNDNEHEEVDLEEYADDVRIGQELVARITPALRELGRLLNKQETRYGEGTFRQYAADIGIDYETAKIIRTTYRAWSREPGRPTSLYVARALNQHPKKYQVWQENPEMSVQDAKTSCEN